tara:strand:- start:527 stop:913 length:387 start_codon:yes stop_codon:yes gene_type:complete
MAYTAIVFDEDTILKLEEEYVALTKNHTEDWEDKFHHLTVCMGTNSKGKYPFQLGDRVQINITHLGHSLMVTAFRCELPEGKSVKSKVPHITCKVNRVDGGKPKHSNDISEWMEIDPFSVKGVVQVCE